MQIYVPNVQLTSSSIQKLTSVVPAQQINSETLVINFAPIVMKIVSLAVLMVQTLMMTNVFAIHQLTSLLLIPKNVLMNVPIITKMTASIVTVSIMFVSNQLYR